MLAPGKSYVFPRILRITLPSSTRHRNITRPTRLIPLTRHNLVIMARPQPHPRIRPRLEMRPDVHTAPRPLTPPYAPELLERLRSVDRRRIGAGALENIVHGPVDGDGPLVRGARGGVVGPEVLDDVVFDERVARPAVDGEVGVAVVLVAAGVLDYPEGGISPGDCVLEWRGKVRTGSWFRGSIPFRRRGSLPYPTRS